MIKLTRVFLARRKKHRNGGRENALITSTCRHCIAFGLQRYLSSIYSHTFRTTYSIKPFNFHVALKCKPHKNYS